MGQVAVGLGLQPNSAELSRNVALSAGRRQRRSSDFTHLGRNKKWQNTLKSKKQRKSWWMEFETCDCDRALLISEWRDNASCGLIHLDDNASTLVLGLQPP